MKLLLDTHILIWALSDDIRLTEKARNLIDHEDSVLFYSVISAWEIAIKHAAHPDIFPYTEEKIMQICEAAGIMPLSLSPRHIPMLHTLCRPDSAPSHKDPFDRIMIAQAKAEGMLFLTHDSLLPFYEEPCVLMV